MTAWAHDLAVEQATESDLTIFPGNARKGVVDKIVESILINGFYTPLVVQRSTGYIIAGNHRFMAAKKAGLTSFPVVYLDVDDAAALKINIADNKLSDDSTYDPEALVDQLTSIDDLIGTGWTEEELAALTGDLEEDEDEDLGAAKAEQTVECPNCSHQFDPNQHRVEF